MQMDQRLGAAAIVLAGGLLFGLLGAGSPAGATGDRPGRYTMSPADGGGFVRLDTETGQMALCQRRDAEWSCRDMAEPGRGLGQEVERLRAENQRLKSEMCEMEDILLGDKRAEAGRGRDGRDGGGRGGFELKLPSEQDIDNAMSYAQRMLRKFREKLRELEADAKGTPL